MMAAAIMAAMQFIVNTHSSRSHTHTDKRLIQLNVCACRRMGLVHVYQSSLVIDKIPQFFNPGGFRDLGGSC